MLRLHGEAALSARKIGKSCSLSPTTVTSYLNRAQDRGLSWPLSPELDDATLERLLFVSPLPADFPQRPLPDWASLHQELKRKGVTLQLLWQEYKATYPEGVQYSQFCVLYRKFVRKLDLALRQEYKAGEKLFVDFAGQTVPVMNPATGEEQAAHIFVAVLGASNYTYALATWSEDLPSWISAHVHAFEFLGGVPAMIIPDNLKAAVSKACRYEPDLNPTYQEMAQHYGTAVLPARVRKTRDKAKVEVGVQIVERWILAALRKRTFFSLAELNSAIRSLLERLNDRPFKKLPGSRRLLFETLDRPALCPLPQGRYEYAEWKKARVNIDYHVEVCAHYYSVPYALVHEQLDVRLTDRTVEIFHKGKRVASHPRSDHAGRHTTQTDHMPQSHQRYLEWTPSRLIHWAEKMGPATQEVVKRILTSRPHPEQGFRACLGILRLGKGYGPDRLEAACVRAIVLKSFSYKSIESILKTGLDRRPLPSESAQTQTFEHENIRGPHYYQ